MNPLAAIGRWSTSLGGRVTLSVILALLIAQILGIFVFASSHEAEQGERRAEDLLRQTRSVATLLNSAEGIDRRGYVRSLGGPGYFFRLDPRPSVEQSTPADELPVLSRDWSLIDSPDKRIQYFQDTRDYSMRFSIAPVPTQKNLRRRVEQSGGKIPPSPDDERAIAEDIPDGPEGPPREPPPGEPGRIGPRPLGFALPPGEPNNAGDPPPDGRPPPRWRMSIALNNGEWLNVEQLYELGLAPWLSTVLYENGVILVLMVLFIVPAVTLSTRRLTQLARAADRLGRGEDTEALPESGSAEIVHLTQSFNAMSLRLRRFVQGRTQMLAGISHDLRTPITALRLRTDLVDDDENRERMQALIDDMHHLTEATLTLAKDESFTEKTDKVDLSSLIEGICDDLQDAGIDATAHVARGVSLTCRPFSLRRAIRNVAENGAKYGKRSRISLEDQGRSVSIVIDDDGPGIPDDQKERAFQPFVRLEGSRSRETGGSGLGLAITRSIVLNHGGEIALANRSEGGLRVTMTLPRGEDV